jgi:cytoskeletal protein RodZ
MMMATVLQDGPAAVQFGELLRAARERRGLTLQQVSSLTKIPQRHLDAIERGDLSVVPDGPYRRGEVRAIAQAVGLDQNVAIAHLNEALGTSARQAPAPAPIDTTGRRAPWLLVLTLAAAIATTAALAIRNRQSALTSGGAEPTQQTPQVHTAQGQSQADRVAPAPVADASGATNAVAIVETPASSVPAGFTNPVLVVTSEPAGARVVVDGIGRGATPLTIQYLPLGEKRVRVVLEGYVSQERRVRLIANQAATTLHIELRPAR